MIHVNMGENCKYLLGEMGAAGAFIEEVDGKHVYDCLTSSGITKEGESVEVIFHNPKRAWEKYFDELLEYLKDNNLPINKLDDPVPEGWVVYWRRLPEIEKLFCENSGTWFFISSRLTCYKLQRICPHCEQILK